MPSASSSGSGRTGDSGQSRSLERRYATALDDSDDRFNTRNGVFYPSGYALFAVPDEGKLADAVDAIVASGIKDDDITLLRPDQMRALTDRSQHEAGVLARIVSAELKQMAVLEQLADAGNHFVMVRNSERSTDLLQSLGGQVGASKGLLFHTLAVEELPVDKETIPGKSPFGVNEVIRTQDSDADMSGKHQP